MSPRPDPRSTWAIGKGNVPIVSVVIPTFRRPTQLADCLTGLLAQHQPPLEVIVVRRADDEPTAEALMTFRGQFRDVVVTVEGQVAALQAGTALAQGSVVAFIDDDAVPRPDWIARLTELFSDQHIGGIGGRDSIHTSTGIIPASEQRVGQIGSWGRSIGNHHIGVGRPREVDTLKGCNMAYRREYLAFPLGLRGAGAQIANDMAVALWAKKQGASIVYDPALVVDHYPASRANGESRALRTPAAQYDAAYNSALVTCTLRPDLRWRYLSYHMAIGTRAIPGLLRWLIAAMRRETLTSRLLITQRGLLAGVIDSRGDALTFWTAP